MAKGRISELENVPTETSNTEKQREHRMKTSTHTHTHTLEYSICVTRTLEGEEREGTEEGLKQEWLKISPKLISDTKPEVQEAQRTPSG